MVGCNVAAGFLEEGQMTGSGQLWRFETDCRRNLAYNSLACTATLLYCRQRHLKALDCLHSRPIRPLIACDGAYPIDACVHIT